MSTPVDASLSRADASGAGRSTAPARGWSTSVGAEAALLTLGALAALLLGGLTSFGQGFADGLGGFANSASGWTLVTVVIVAALVRRAWTGALLGVVSFTLLNLGYSVVSTLRGNPDSFTGFWVVIGFVVGAPVGVCAFWSTKRHPIRTALGAGALAAIGLGEAVEGALHPSALTPVYLAAIAVLAVVLLAVTAVRLRAARSLTVEVLSTGALALAYVLVFSTLSG